MRFTHPLRKLCLPFEVNSVLVELLLRSTSVSFLVLHSPSKKARATAQPVKNLWLNSTNRMICLHLGSIWMSGFYLLLSDESRRVI